MKFRKEMQGEPHRIKYVVHIIIFVLSFGNVLVWESRLDPAGRNRRPTEQRLFYSLRSAEIFWEWALTMTDGKDVVYQEGHRMEKNLDGAYTEELEVSVNGRKPQKFDVEIPEKETEETEVEPEQEVNEAEQRQKE